MKTPPPYIHCHAHLNGITRLGFHDHACRIYSTAEEQIGSSAAFLKIGITRHERCFYVAADRTQIEGVSAALSREGFDVSRLVARRALTLVAAPLVDPHKVLIRAEQSARIAKASGFTGLRLVNDMSWMENRDDAERFIALESQANAILPKHDVVALCQYHRSRFAPEVLRDVIRTHPWVVMGDMVRRNPHFVPHAEFLAPPNAAVELDRLIGTLQRPTCEPRPVSTLVPICAGCKDIRENGVWIRIEEYLGRRFATEFTHTFCPSCLDRIYPETDPKESVLPSA